MISYLTGNILSLNTHSLGVLTQSGVGYDVGINELTYGQLVGKQEVHIHIYHHITENNQSLFGFLDENEKTLFIHLIKISGIGGKVAQQILSMGIETLLHAIQNEESKAIESVKGVGKKMAEKIILEMKQKEFNIPFIKGNTSFETCMQDSIRSTLLSLGYLPKDIDRVWASREKNITDTQEILSHMIRELG